jgi:hypothetical protein
MAVSTEEAILHLREGIGGKQADILIDWMQGVQHVVDTETASLAAVESAVSALQQTALVTVTAAQVLLLNGTPITLVAAPGAGLAIVVDEVVVFMDYATTAYTEVAAGEDLAVKYTDASGATIATIETDGFLTLEADAVRYVTPTTTAAFTPVANSPVVLNMLTGNIATGDSPLKVRTSYHLIPTAW